MPGPANHHATQPLGSLTPPPHPPHDISKADELEEVLCHKFTRFLMQRADQFIIMRRKAIEVGGMRRQRQLRRAHICLVQSVAVLLGAGLLGISHSSPTSFFLTHARVIQSVSWSHMHIW